MRSRKNGDLLELDDVERRMKPFARHYLGVRAIPIDHVVGTEDRASSFTRDFRPRHEFSRDRLRSLAGAFPDGGFPPIVAVKLGETYFVIDGHHRVALTRRNGGKMIDADVTELVARVPLPPGADMVEVVLRELERVFIEQSGLAEARPGVRVSASRPSLYLELLENLQVHGYHLMRERERVLDNKEIAADWYDTIYSPVVETAERTWSDDVPGADVFLLLHQRRREAFPSCGCPPLAETVPAEPPRKRRRLFGR
jgi:ParB-like nuclease family protein